MAAEFRGPSPHDLGTAELATAPSRRRKHRSHLASPGRLAPPHGPDHSSADDAHGGALAGGAPDSHSGRAAVNFGSTASSTPPRRRRSRSPGSELPMRLERPGTFFR